MKTRLFVLCALCALLYANGPPCPATGVVGSAYSVDGLGIELEVRGDLVYFADWGRGSGTFQVFDVSDLANPVRLSGHLNMGQEIGDMVMVGDTAHVANDANHYRIVDASNEYAPVVTGAFHSGSGGFAHSIWYDGGRYAYVGYGWANYVAIFDMNVPGLLRRIHFSGAYGVRDVHVVGTTLYTLLSASTAQLVALDVTNPSNPVTLGSLPVPRASYGYCCQIKIQGNYAYLAASNYYSDLGGLRIVDVSNPAAMTVTGQHDFSTTGAYARGIGLEVVGDRVYLAAEGGLSVYDVGNVTAPRLLTRLPMPASMPNAFGTAVRVRGDFAFMAAYHDASVRRGGLVIYRVKVPIEVLCSINPKSKGVIPVVILSTPDFDATTVDAATVRFGPDGASKAKNDPKLVDINDDGRLDMKFHFRCQDTGIGKGDTEARLEGYTNNDCWFEGTATIRTVGK